MIGSHQQSGRMFAVSLSDAREIIRRYEQLVEAAIASEVTQPLPTFSVSYPARIEGDTLLVEENVEGDPWRLRTIQRILS